MRDFLYVAVILSLAMLFGRCGGEVDGVAADAGDEPDACACVTCAYPTPEPCP